MAFSSTGLSRWTSWERAISLYGYLPIRAGVGSKNSWMLAASPATRLQTASPAFT
jgi:hypothetical protein